MPPSCRAALTDPFANLLVLLTASKSVLEVATSGPGENRQRPAYVSSEEAIRLKAQAWYDGSQTFEDVIRARIRERREALGFSQADLEREIERAGFSLTPGAVAKIEQGRRRIGVDELAVVAYALGRTPLADLLKPLDGERPVRVGEVLLMDRGDVPNWLLWGPPWTAAARWAQRVLRPARLIAEAHRFGTSPSIVVSHVDALSDALLEGKPLKTRR